MMAWKPSSDSCISSEGEGCTGLCPATAMKSPIALMSGFNALAALPPAPPSEIACAWLRGAAAAGGTGAAWAVVSAVAAPVRSEEHTSELQSRLHLVCRLLLEKKKKKNMHSVCHLCSYRHGDPQSPY